MHSLNRQALLLSTKASHWKGATNAILEDIDNTHNLVCNLTEKSVRSSKLLTLLLMLTQKFFTEVIEPPK